MTPKVIKNDSEHEAALARASALMDAAPGSAAEAELELWGVLIEKYEEEHFPIERPDPIAAIQFRMEQMDLTQADLARYIPSKSKRSEILSRRIPLSLNMIRSLHRGLNIPAEVLVQDYFRRRSGAKRVAARKAGRRSGTMRGKPAMVH